MNHHGNRDTSSKQQIFKSFSDLLSIKQLESNARKKFAKKYKKDITKQYNSKVLDELIFNRNTHLVALFKEHMIADYIDEFLKREYKSKESKERIPKFSQYYQNYSIFFGMPTFSGFTANEIIKEYGEKKAEVYYNKHYKNINDDDDEDLMIMNNSDNDSSLCEGDKISRIMIDKTIFNSKLKENIDNGTMFTNRNTESNMVSCSNTILKHINSTNRSKAINESSLIINAEEIIASTVNNNNNNNLASNEASLISYIKLFNKHQNNKAKQINRRIQVKKLCAYPPTSVLSKRKNTTKDSELGIGTGTNSEMSNHIISNQSITRLKGIISASNLYCTNNIKQQLDKTPMSNNNNNNIKSNISNNSNASNHNLNTNLSKKSLSVKKNKSRNVKQSDIGFKTDNIHNGGGCNKRNNNQSIQLAKTQKIDSIIKKYTINYSTKKLTSSLKKKGNTSSQLKLNLKNPPVVVSQLGKKTMFKLNPKLLKGKNLNAFNINNNNNNQDRPTSHSKPKLNRNPSKKSADDLMKMALTLLMENKTSKPNSTLNANATSNANSNSNNAHVNININNQININTNYPIQDSIHNKLSKNDTVARNINNNLCNLLKSTKHSRNKSSSNGLGLVSDTDDDKTIGSNSKGRIFSSYCLGEKKQKCTTITAGNKKNETPNVFNRPRSNDLVLKQNQHHPQYQQHQIQSYLCKETRTKPRLKITNSSSNRLFQTMNQPLLVNTYTKSITFFKSKKQFN